MASVLLQHGWPHVRPGRPPRREHPAGLLLRGRGAGEAARMGLPPCAVGNEESPPRGCGRSGMLAGLTTTISCVAATVAGRLLLPVRQGADPRQAGDGALQASWQEGRWSVLHGRASQAVLRMSGHVLYVGAWDWGGGLAPENPEMVRPSGAHRRHAACRDASAQLSLELPPMHRLPACSSLCPSAGLWLP